VETGGVTGVEVAGALVVVSTGPDVVGGTGAADVPVGPVPDGATVGVGLDGSILARAAASVFMASMAC
jgi:hypothetical protein